MASIKKKYFITRFLFVITMLTTLFLSNCYKPSKEYIDKQAKLQSFYQNIENYCQIKLNDNLDWHVATIYYKNNDDKLENADKKILDTLISLQSKCNNHILLIGNISDFEYNSDSKASLKLSYNRAQNIYDYLVKYKIDKSYIHILACSNLAKRKLNEFEIKDQTNNNSTNQVYKYNNINQFVEIIFLNTPFKSHKDDCFKNKTSINIQS